MATTCSAKTVRDQTNALKGHTVVIVGGSCGMGKGSAIHVLQKGAAVILVSRSAEKLDKAKKECEAAVPSGQVSVRAVDCSDETAVQKLFASFTPGSINHLIVTGGPSAGCGAFEADTLAKVKKQFDVKYFMSWMCAHEAAPKLADGGSITFFSGALSRRLTPFLGLFQFFFYIFFSISFDVYIFSFLFTSIFITLLSSLLLSSFFLCLLK